MTLKKKQLYAAIVALGACALLVDRFLILKETGALQSASASTQSSSPESARTAIASSEDETAIPELHFPKDIPKVALDDQLRDWFEPPASPSDPSNNLQINSLTSHKGNFKKLPPPQTPSERLVSEHHLNAIIDTPTVKVAVVDGEWIRIGETVGECTLSALAGRSAHFSCLDADVTMSLFDSLLKDATSTSDNLEENPDLLTQEAHKRIYGKNNEQCVSLKGSATIGRYHYRRYGFQHFF